jgi:transcription antitermination factor NusG
LQPCWALVVTEPRGERIASNSLARHQIQHFIFKHEVLRLRRGIMLTEFVPAFPRYIFVYMLETFWALVRGLTGVLDYVRIGAAPAIIAEEVVGKLVSQAKVVRAGTDVHHVLPLQPVDERFVFGDRVAISEEGVTYGCEGLYQYKLRTGRCVVLMPWLGQMVQVEVDEKSIEPLLVSGRLPEILPLRETWWLHGSAVGQVVSLQCAACVVLPDGL